MRRGVVGRISKADKGGGTTDVLPAAPAESAPKPTPAWLQVLLKVMPGLLSAVLAGLACFFVMQNQLGALMKGQAVLEKQFEQMTLTDVAATARIATVEFTAMRAILRGDRFERMFERNDQRYEALTLKIDALALGDNTRATMIQVVIDQLRELKEITKNQARHHED